ncbi:MAG TPA: helix-turn-helix domain-containing protein [Ignavibacteriaceae bacterium]|nr:helix-turn-helix domain-containing protein [Ignavibacteriaceae bacterium]
MIIIMIFQLLVFSLFLLIRKAKNVSNYLLALQLFSQMAGIANGFCFRQFDFFFNKFPHLFFAGFPFSFLWGPTFYLYARSASFTDFKLKLRHLFHFIPFFTAIIFLLFSFYPLGYEEKRIMLVKYDFPLYLYGKYIDIFLRTQVFVYIILSVLLLYNVKQKIKQRYSSISQTHIGWIEFLVAGFSIAFLLTIPIIIYLYIYGRQSDTFVIFISLPYFIYFNIILFKAWYRSEIFAGVEEGKYKSSKLARKEAEGLIEKLKQYVDCKKPYLNSELTLGQLAENLNISPRILSQVINEYFNQNFYDYINRLRVEESKKILLDLSNKKTVLEILYDVGFNTKSSYNVAFKRATGLTPTEFKRRYSYKTASTSE